MNAESIHNSDELDALRYGIEILSNSSNAQDLCRRAALAEFMNGQCRGVAIYLLDQRSALVEIANFGKGHDFGQDEILAWDNSLLSHAVRSRKIETEENGESRLLALPIQHAGVTTGVMTFNMSNTGIPKFSDDFVEMMSALVGIFMENKGISLRPSKSSSAHEKDDEDIAVHELTSRQIKIISLIAEGLTNAEIAKRVLLSESTVRQETIRIYRIMKCHDRSSAIAKARANGIIAGVTAE